MHLLKRTQDGGFCVTEDLDEIAVPPYAILSHTWGAEAEEVTFEDIQSGGGRTKLGYKKIRFCGQQAEQDELQYFWVDTCCIDKANKAAFSHAINSMYRWYQNARRCYVYLDDLLDPADEFSPPLREGLRKSRWFTRGWTLQELLAPEAVDFFTHNWVRVGDKASLRQHIHEITGISHTVLQGAPIAQLGVEERLSWNVHRHTTLGEDKIYSLLGIFDVYLSPFYGEGASKARDRLMDQIKQRERCIQDLRSGDPRDDKRRIEETKGGLLEGAYCWVLDNTSFQQWRSNPNSQLLWIKGDPGKGKTMLLCGIINELQKAADKSTTIAYFFCQATDSRINTAVAVLRGLMYMIVVQRPSLISHIRKKYDQAGKSLFEDTNAWAALTEMSTNILSDPGLGTTYLLVDALDECVADLPKLLNFVAKNSSVSSRVKWIVSSRNWPDIEEPLERAGNKVRLSLELNAESVSSAVSIFVKQKVSELAQRKKYNEQTRDAVLEHLLSNANDTFLWVALVCQSLEGTAKRNILKKLSLFPSGLDSLYERMLLQIGESDDTELCMQVLAFVALVYRPVTLQELAAMVEPLGDLIDVEAMQEIIGFCGSFLSLREDTIHFVHQSAKEFLLNRADKRVFPSGRADVHHSLFTRSLQILSATLHRDMYGLMEPGYSIENVEPPLPDPLAAACYSCIYWADHLRDAHLLSPATYAKDLWDGGTVDIFLKNEYLYLLEGLSLCRSLPAGVTSLDKLQSIVQDQDKAAQLLELLHDAFRFAMYHKWAIENYPLQTYASALLFSPTGSLIKGLFRREEPKAITIKPEMSDGWSACLQTFERHDNAVTSVAFSHDSTQLASGSWDNTVKLWDVGSGTCLQTLRGHEDSVRSITFSHNSTQLASASKDNTIKLWDVGSGKYLQTFRGHSGAVTSMAFSHNSTQLASASIDDTVKLWDIGSGTCLQTLTGHSGAVTSVAFSSDSTRLASASEDNTVKLWDVGSDTCLRTLRGHKDSVASIAFSHNSNQLASASKDATVKLWDVGNGTCLQTSTGHSGALTSVAFSHDSARLALVSSEGAVELWDASNGICLQIFTGLESYVKAAVFSHDSTRLASASEDGTVKLWDTSGSECLQMFTGHSGPIASLAFSNDSTLLASGSWDNTVKLWDISSGAYLQTFRRHRALVDSIAFSHDSNKLVSASFDGAVKIWDASSGMCLQTLKGLRGATTSVAFSHDSTQLALTSEHSIVKIWDMSRGAYQNMFDHYSGDITSIVFSHDSTQLATVSDDDTIWLWDVRSGTCLKKLRSHHDAITSIAFLYDSTRLASASENNTIKVWDMSKGTCLQTLYVSRTLHSLSIITFNLRLYAESDASAMYSPGTSGIAANTEPKLPYYIGTDLSLDRTWIMHNGKNILCIPSEYRPSCSSVCGNTVSIGTMSGRIWTCNINPKQARMFS